MSLFSKKNLDKAKAMAEKNAGKIADGVKKTTKTIDEKTKGKYAGHLRKVDDAAQSFARKTDGDATGTTKDEQPER
jgi:hypothetical protein